MSRRIRHRALAQDHDLHVAAADVADHVRVGDVVQRGGGVRHRLDDRHVGADDVLQQVLAVAGDREGRRCSRSPRRGSGGTALSRPRSGCRWTARSSQRATRPPPTSPPPWPWCCRNRTRPAPVPRTRAGPHVQAVLRHSPPYSSRNTLRSSALFTSPLPPSRAFCSHWPFSIHSFSLSMPAYTPTAGASPAPISTQPRHA